VAGEGERQEGAEDDEGDFSEYAHHLRDKYGEPEEEEETGPRETGKEAAEGNVDAEVQDEASTFREYVEELKEKYGAESDVTTEGIEDLGVAGNTGADLQNGHPEIDSEAKTMPPADDGSGDWWKDAVATDADAKGSNLKEARQPEDDDIERAAENPTAEESGSPASALAGEESGIRGENRGESNSGDRLADGHSNRIAVEGEGVSSSMNERGSPVKEPPSQEPPAVREVASYQPGLDNMSLPRDTKPTSDYGLVLGPDVHRVDRGGGHDTPLGGNSSIESTSRRSEEKSDQLEKDEREEQPLAVIRLKAYEYQIQGREPDIRFDIRSVDFERRTGVEMKDGKIYEIHGWIGDVEFTKNHLEKEGNHVIFMVPKDHRDEIQPGRRYDITVDRVKEKTEFTVDGYGDGRTVLDFQPTFLASLGLDSGKAEEAGVVAFEVENLIRDKGHPRTLFTKLEPYDCAARLAVTSLGWRQGDCVRVNKVSDFPIKSFVNEFNESRETRGANLVLDGQKASLSIDERIFPTTKQRYDTHCLKVNLTVKIEPVLRDIRLWYDGEQFTPKIRDCRILQFKASSHELKIVHEDSGRNVTASRFNITPLEQRQEPLKDLDIGLVSKNLIVPQRFGGPEGDYDFSVKPPLNMYVSEWIRAVNLGQVAQRMGTISEEMVSRILEESGWSLVRKHPSVKNGMEFGSNKPGFDRLMRWNLTGELGLFEVRWQQNLDSAFAGARYDVENRVTEDPAILQNPPKSVYIGILEWRKNEIEGTLHVERFHSKRSEIGRNRARRGPLNDNGTSPNISKRR